MDERATRLVPAACCFFLSHPPPGLAENPRGKCVARRGPTGTKFAVIIKVVRGLGEVCLHGYDRALPWMRVWPPFDEERFPVYCGFTPEAHKMKPTEVIAT
ncbi:ABC transporter ATP-binding protein [Anopheles sinensis]|uniref:ABC transporter ATP-binding protein n=1 Tax=Anopheles sinensis TaxID=74873 RepID=A0A084VDR7_ANOSI|nr:ABC transporter ATP-binding protein [Anopheles sinensis]